ncbi:MAG TPA: Wzz/FepE/Etk N-terminal domain-containing protein, partial [Sphingobacteriaceae bacterium]|nr:Wzz/FepE/Etk N-terminal domain-containing protein [Sphingobacteriaceae bacterium]
MQYKELNNDETASNENSLALREILERLLQNWYWFVLGFVIAWAGAYIYLRYTENLYRAEAKVLLKEDLSTSSSELSALVGKGMGRGDTKPNISDQIEIMRSRRLIGKVVDNLQLNIRYFSDGRVKQQELLDEASPVKVKVLTKEPSFVNFEVLVKSESDIEIIYNEKALKSTFGKPIKLGKVEFIVLPRNVSPGRSVQVTILPLESGISMYRGRLSIAPINEGSVVSVSMVDNLSGRAKRVIDELISQYNEDALYDKQLIGEKTTRFIEERLAKVSEDLRSKDRDVEGFKKDNQVIDLQTEGGISLSESSANNSQVLAQSTQLSLVNSMQDYLRSNKNDLVPENIGLDDAAVNANAAKYNTLILTKMDMLKHSTESSQLVKNLDEQIEDIRTNLQQSLNNYKKTTQISLNRLQGEGGRISSKIHRFPTQEKEFKDIARQQQIVEELYLFLLQKREENEITNAATPSSIKVVDYAYSNNYPISPNRQNIYLMATAAGLLVPFAVLYLLFLLNNKVQTRKDIEKLGPSIIGDIPSTRSDEIIGHNDRSILAESFRMLRTNIGFYLSNKKSDSRKIFITSTVSGEGKTFAAS